MAEALARHYGHEAESAGTHPGSDVAPNSLSVLEELGVSTQGLRPKSVDDIETEGWDMIISMGCGVECPMLPIAEDLNVDLCMENVWNGFFYSPIELRDFVDSFDSDKLSVYLDIGNLIGYQQYPPHWIELLNSRIKRVQIKDFQENFDWTGSFSFCDIGAGDVPWKETIAALNSIQYESTIIAEMLPWDETILSRTSVAMDQLFNFK